MLETEARRLLQISDQNELSTPSQLRKYYLKAALACHPDKNPGVQNATETFASLQEAYNFLLERISNENDLIKEKARTQEIYNLFLRALNGDNIEQDLQRLGVYRPSDSFGIDLAVPFDRRLPPLNNTHGEETVDIKGAFAEAFADEGLDEEGNPLEGWARPPAVDLEDL